MTIVEALKKLIAERGGSTTGIHTIADAIKVLTALEASEETDSNEVG